MRPLDVVVLAVVLDDNAGLDGGPAPLAIEAFVAEAGVEQFHKAAPPRSRRYDVDGLNFQLC